MVKAIKYVLLAAVIGITCYNAVYFEDLDKFKAKMDKTIFDAKVFVTDFMSNEMTSLSAIDAETFISNIEKDLKSYAQKNGNKLGISNDYYFLIEGNGTADQIDEEYVLVTLNEGSSQKIRIATDFIFGNAVREACVMADIGDYQNTMDYNNISIEVNTIIRETILPPFIETIKTGDDFYFKGAVRVNIKKPNLDNLRVIPLKLIINN